MIDEPACLTLTELCIPADRSCSDWSNRSAETEVEWLARLAHMSPLDKHVVSRIRHPKFG